MICNSGKSVKKKGHKLLGPYYGKMTRFLRSTSTMVQMDAHS